MNKLFYCLTSCNRSISTQGQVLAYWCHNHMPNAELMCAHILALKSLLPTDRGRPEPTSQSFGKVQIWVQIWIYFCLANGTTKTPNATPLSFSESSAPGLHLAAWIGINCVTGLCLAAIGGTGSICGLT